MDQYSYLCMRCHRLSLSLTKSHGIKEKDWDKEMCEDNDGTRFHCFHCSRLPISNYCVDCALEQEKAVVGRVKARQGSMSQCAYTCMS